MDAMDVIQISIKQAIEHMAVPDPEDQELRDAVAYQVIGLIRSLCDESMRRILDDGREGSEKDSKCATLSDAAYSSADLLPGSGGCCDPYFPDSDL